MNVSIISGGIWPMSAELRPLRRRHSLYGVGLALFVALWSLLQPPARAAENPETQAKQVWQLLDYVAVDYGGAVAQKKVLNAAEYQEMQEFTVKAERQLSDLPDQAKKTTLQRQAAELRQAVTDKTSPATVAHMAHGLADAVLKAYPFPVAPAALPDLAHGATLFQAQCASCHGAQGRGDGPLAASLNPHPIAFADHGRARERSLFALHQAISNGVPGTSMQSYKALPEADRWDLAFFVGTLAYSEADQLTGAKLWEKDVAARQAMVSLDALAQTSEQALAEQLPAPAAKSLTAYLRTHPQALEANTSGGLALARAKLAESMAAAQKGDRVAASKLALSAYLDGFEPVEPMLALKDRALFLQVESSMVAYRATVAQGSPADVQAAQQKLNTLLQDAERALAPAKGDAAATFIGALTILLREGLEALLVVVGMLAFLKKADRRDMLPYVHAGWVSALAAGGLTWASATYLVAISGASRELTEGFSSLFAAVVLLAVGMWMHQKSVAGRWQIYLKEKLSAALSKRAAWFLFSLAFIAVYREVFETVLFYAALWTEGNGLSLLAGLGTGIVLLAGLTVVLLRTSARLPIGQFFAASSLLVSVLAVVLAGKGIAGLQEAGLLPITTLPLPRFELLGMYPSWQTVAAQLLVLLAAVVAYLLNQRSGRRLATQALATAKPSTPHLERTTL
jgi:high-affinity iron transporter